MPDPLPEAIITVRPAGKKAAAGVERRACTGPVPARMEQGR